MKVIVEFRLRIIDETRNYLLGKIKHNDLMSENYKETKSLNYLENLLILASTVTDCVSVSAFSSLVDIPVGITSSAVGIDICAITAGIKNYKSMTTKKKKKHDKIALFVKDKLNAIEVPISKCLIHSYISHDKFVSVKNVLREYNETQKEIKRLLWNILCKNNINLLCQL